MLGQTVQRLYQPAVDMAQQVIIDYQPLIEGYSEKLSSFQKAALAVTYASIVASVVFIGYIFHKLSRNNPNSDSAPSELEDMSQQKQ